MSADDLIARLLDLAGRLDDDRGFTSPSGAPCREAAATIASLKEERDEALDDAKFAERIATKREIDANAERDEALASNEALRAALEKAMKENAEERAMRDGWHKRWKALNALHGEGK